MKLGDLEDGRLHDCPALWHSCRGPKDHRQTLLIGMLLTAPRQSHRCCFRSLMADRIASF